jgi:hypothetical protein
MKWFSRENKLEPEATIKPADLRDGSEPPHPVTPGKTTPGTRGEGLIGNHDYPGKEIGDWEIRY